MKTCEILVVLPYKQISYNWTVLINMSVRIICKMIQVPSIVHNSGFIQSTGKVNKGEVQEFFLNQENDSFSKNSF